MRGNHGTHVHAWECSRSIPACAGEPPPSSLSQQQGRVYPRVCGGTNGGVNEGQHFFRSIPACAGEPKCGSLTSSSKRVYPRVCGGTTAPRRRRGVVTGLSPRVRGNQAVPPLSTVCVRSIPACAGEPRPGRGPPGSRTVYPRVCGGTLRKNLAQRENTGLSPRVRGNLVQNHL